MRVIRSNGARLYFRRAWHRVLKYNSMLSDRSVYAFFYTEKMEIETDQIISETEKRPAFAYAGYDEHSNGTLKTKA